jgi:hypothetical protein
MIPIHKSTTEGWQQLDTRPQQVGDLYEFFYQGRRYLASADLVIGKTDGEIIAAVCVDDDTFIKRLAQRWL